MNKYKIVISIFLILIITSIAFLPSLKNGFVNNDDPLYLIENRLVQNLSWENIKKIFTSYHCLNYHPLAFLSYSLEYRFFKLNPFVYHLTNLVLHLFNCLLVFWFLRLFSGSVLVSFIAALLFGVHPLHVESVVWISERRDVLYSFFFLSALIGYLYYIKNKSRKYYYLAIALFALSLLAKAMAITLPLLMLLVDYIFDNRISKNNLKDKIPFFTIAILFGVITFAVRYSSKDFSPKATSNLYYNIFVITFALLFYIIKMFIPVKLSCMYPYAYGEIELLNPIFLSSPFVLAALIGGIIYSSKYSKKLIFGSVFFVISMLPTINVIPSMRASSVVADRYFYISSIGLFYLVGEFFYWIYRRKTKYRGTIIIFLAIAFMEIISILSILTWDRCNVWENSFALWDNAIRNYPNGDIPIAYFDRGITYINKREDKKAIFDFKKALDLNYKRLGINQNYEEDYIKTLMDKNGYVDMYNFLGFKFADLGKTQEAIILFKKVIEINPANIQAYINLSAAYGDAGRYKEAIEIANKAIELDSNSAQVHNNLAVAYYFDDQYDLALKHIKIATELGFKPDQGFLEKLIRKLNK